MQTHAPRAFAALAVVATAGVLALALPGAAHAAGTPDVRITEWMYKSEATAGEFVELTNVGAGPVDLAGWSYATSGGGAGQVPLTAFGEVAAGESVVLTEAPAATFRSQWGLDAHVKIVGDVTHNIGRAGDVEVYDADGTLVDRLAYDDQGTGTLKGPRTDGVSGVPKSAAALGSDDASQWQLSVAGDADHAWAATVGGASDLGSPGTSRFGDGRDPRASDGGGDDGGDPGTGTGVDPHWADVRINEVSSDNGDTPVGDAVELVNTGASDVSIAGWLQIDSGAAASATAFAAKLPDGAATTTIPAHGYVYFSSTKGLGSGGDGVKVYLPDGPDGTAGTLVDSVTYTAGQAGADETDDFGAGAFARCPDGTGDFASVVPKSFGASNTTACASPVTDPAGGGDGGGSTLTCEPEAPSGTGTLPATALPATTWPGSADVTLADAPCAWTTTTGPEGRDVSGLAFDPTDANVLYAVKNKSWVFRLVKQDGRWVPDTSNDWGAGKEIFFPGDADPQTNQPDTEGLTVGADGALYVTTERNNQANTIPLNSILRFDPTEPGDQLVATDQWDLTSEFPELHAGNKTEANLGFEGVAFVPDSYLTANGFVDESTGATYRPGDYLGHGTGLYFAGLENDGKLYAYALDADHTYHRVAVVDTGMGHVMDVQFDASTQRIWALCDNTCGVASTVLKMSSTGAVVPEVVYAKPAGLPVDNLEGFAVAPASTCVDGTREVLWSDDGIYGTGRGSASEGHALYSGRISCDLGLGEQGVPRPGAWDATTAYGAGDQVSSGGAVFEALWWTKGEKPGNATGAWAEIATAADGTAAWTASRVFDAGDVVVYQGRTFKALWWTRNQVPGGVGGPWSEVVSAAAGTVPAWSAATLYVGGEKVTYQGHVYQAQWWTSGDAPAAGAKKNAWVLVG
ncbi:lamin tail domain-containing protein [Luteimicrobium sp. DT211]|uniref:lamin tail domain-containing protein n=1 Tax=Luteimicrobium sp. DT211 TaxID=3393412 RepID=UPI003CE7297C